MYVAKFVQGAGLACRRSDSCTGQSGVRTAVGEETFSSPYPVRLVLWCNQLPVQQVPGLCLGGKCGRGMTLVTNCYPGPRLRMGREIPLLSLCATYGMLWVDLYLYQFLLVSVRQVRISSQVCFLKCCEGLRFWCKSRTRMIFSLPSNTRRKATTTSEVCHCRHRCNSGGGRENKCPSPQYFFYLK